MSMILVQEVFAGPALAAGVTIASVAVAVTDSSGAVQNAKLTGAESPTPWAASFTVVAGKGSVSSVRTDSTGAAGTAIVQAYDTAGPALVLDLSGTTITITTP